MKKQTQHTDDCFDGGVANQWCAQSPCIATDQQRANCHPSQKNRQHQDLGVRAVTDEEREVARPDRFVHQPRHSGEEEQRVEGEEHQLPPPQPENHSIPQSERAAANFNDVKATLLRQRAQFLRLGIGVFGIGVVENHQLPA